MTLTTSDVAFLASVPLFADLDAGERARLAEYLHETRLGEGQVVLWEGRSHAELHVLEAGEVVVTKVVRGDVESVLATLAPTAHFGELDLIDGRQAAATVTATIPSRLLSIDRGRLMRLFEEDSVLFSKIAWAMLRDLAGKLRRTNLRLLEAVAWGLDASVRGPD